MVLRLSKALLAGLVGVLLLLVGFDNTFDYSVNFAAVQHVMSMDTVSGDDGSMWRAITTPALHHIAYAIIIMAELASGALCVWGALRLWRLRRAPAPVFNAGKDVAAAGLVIAAALYLFAFLTIGGEWFDMWRSPTWNAQASAFRFFATAGLVLLFVSQKDDELA
jgi:predicted small integral membrane protein